MLFGLTTYSIPYGIIGNGTAEYQLRHLILYDLHSLVATCSATFLFAHCLKIYMSSFGKLQSHSQMPQREHCNLNELHLASGL